MTARELWRQSQESAKDLGANGFAAFVGADVSVVEALLGDANHAREDARVALNLLDTPQTEELAALTLALAGDGKQAEKLIPELDKGYPPESFVQRYWLPLIRAALALGRNDANRAIELLRAKNAYELALPGLYQVYLRGQVHLMLRNSNAAKVEFQKILNHPGLVLEFRRVLYPASAWPAPTLCKGILPEHGPPTRIF